MEKHESIIGYLASLLEAEKNGTLTEYQKNFLKDLRDFLRIKQDQAPAS